MGVKGPRHGVEDGSDEGNPFDVDRPMLKFKDMLAEINTSLTPEQRAHVEMLKTKYIHGSSGRRSPYRNVPTPEELDAMPDDQQYRPFVPENADELIDWALSHVPPRTGKRGSRRAKRMEHRHALRRKNAAWRRQGEALGRERRAEKAQRQQELANMYRQMGAEIRAAKAGGGAQISGAKGEESSNATA